ncbi:MAG: choice-of-anchor D domain-containing protein, partial [Candidatus Eisenbacteria bacterium]
NNQFTFVGDTRGFFGQHDIRRLPNGHVTLFDNANCQTPVYSRGLEYLLDETNKVATLVREFRNSPDTFTPFMGNVQRRADGGTMIGWGGTGPDPKITDLHADGSLAWSVGFQNPARWTYRAFRFPWHTSRFVATPEAYDFGNVEVGEYGTLMLSVRNGSATPVTINSIVGHHPEFSVATALPVTIAAGATQPIEVRFTPPAVGSYDDTLSVRSVSATELVAQTVTLRGTGVATGLSISDVALREGDAGARQFAFQVRLAQPRASSVNVHVQTSDGTATVADHDYSKLNVDASIPAGDLFSIVDVTVHGDVAIEPDETFFVELSNANVAINDAQAVGLIVNDDGPLSVGADLPRSFALYPARPNPARGTAVVRYDLPRACDAYLEVLDLAGRHVAWLVDGAMPAGRQEARWAPPAGTTGVFFYRLRAGEFTSTRKTVFVR